MIIGSPIYVYISDDGEVIETKGGFIWHYDIPESGEEFVPEDGAAEYFDGCGREDIAECIRTRQAYRYGKYEPF